MRNRLLGQLLPFLEPLCLLQQGGVFLAQLLLPLPELPRPQLTFIVIMVVLCAVVVVDGHDWEGWWFLGGNDANQLFRARGGDVADDNPGGLER